MGKLDAQIAYAQDMLTSHHYNNRRLAFLGGGYDISACPCDNNVGPPCGPTKCGVLNIFLQYDNNNI